MSDAKLQRIVHLLYGANLDPTLWRQALEETMALVGGCGGAVEFVNHETVEFDIKAHTGYDLEAALASPDFHEWPRHDPWTPETIREPENAVLIATRHVPAADFINSTFSNEFIQPYGADWRDFIGIAPKVEGGGRHLFAIYRWSKHENFGQHELELMQALQPHILTALAINRQLGDLTRLVGSLETALDERPDAVLILDHLRRPISYNTRAKEMLSGRSSLLTVHGGALHLRQRDIDQRFQHLLTASLQSARTLKHAPETHQALVWNDAKTGEILSVRVTPDMEGIAPGHLRLGKAEATVIVSISDFRPNAERIAGRMQTAFRLTPAETRLLRRLVAGARLDAICDETGVAMNTVRGQLREVFSKTCTSSQAELIAMALNGF